MPRRIRGGRWGLATTAALLLLWAAAPARADHSLGRSCLSCHALRSTKVVSGSRNILSDNVLDTFYTSAFYCDVSWGGGEPLDCGYCHGSPGDIANEIQFRTASSGSSHPVPVSGDAVTYATAVRITCNDCHNGDQRGGGALGDQPDGVPDLTAGDLCSKTTPSGYPNHQKVVETGAPTGSNRLADNPPRLSGRYGPLGGATSSLGGVDWSKATLTANDLLCFVCHDGDASTDPPFAAGLGMLEDVEATPKNDGSKASNIAYEYNRAGGGHNVTYAGPYGPGIGGLGFKLPCYDCHDPHAATDTGAIQSGNAALVLNGLETTVNAYETSSFSVQGYTGANDRAVCYGCHLNSNGPVEGVTPPNPATVTPVFPFHANVHSGVASGGNCLQPNGGCHQSAHNTDFFRCLDCHSTQRHANSHASLAAVEHVDSEFGLVGYVTGNGIKSSHSIGYDPAANLSLAANNGCLHCHDTRGITSPARAIVKVYGGTTGLARPNLSARVDLRAYDAFCLSCHDGSGANFGALVAPQVDAYFATEGHGRSSGSYASGNSAANVPCLECHLYHGSTAYKLLPGDAATTDGKGQVVKRPAGPTTGTKFTIGPLDDSTHIDYTDYTEPGTSNNSNLPSGWQYPAWYVSEYTALWTTYSDDTSLSPQGAVTTKFGTSGDVRGLNSSSPELTCGGDADSIKSSTSSKIGFCNSCHFYNDSTDGTTSTYGKAYTHEGVVPGTTCSGGKDLKSQKNFFKDCSECHDPHGSGRRGGSNANLYMVRGKIKHGATTQLSHVTTDGNWSKVEFTSKGSSPVAPDDNSYEEDDTGAGESNADDLCAACHVVDPAAGTPIPPRDPLATPNVPGVDHNYRAYTGAPTHNQGSQCTTCHNHNNNLVSNPSSQKNIAANGFGLAGTCSGCHGGGTDVGGNKNEWPDGSSPRDENTPGRHLVHIQRLAQAAFGETINQLLTNNANGNSSDKQHKLCEYCHAAFANDGDHGNPANLPAEVFTDSGGTRHAKKLWDPAASVPQNTDIDAVYARPTDTCATVDCHNSKTTTTVPPEDFRWYGANASACTMCHTVGAAGVNPVSGIHLAQSVVAGVTGPTVSGVSHDDSFLYNNGASTGVCTTCHGAVPTTLGGHWNGVSEASIGLNDLVDPRVNLVPAVGFADAAAPAAPTCAPSIAGCHLEQSVTDPATGVPESWARLWHENAGQNNGSECAGCHGDWTSGWRTGVKHRTDADTQTIHGSGSYRCRDCHVLQNAAYAFTLGTNDWDRSATEASNHGNAQITVNDNQTGFGRQGVSPFRSGCGACHAAYDGVDGALNQHSFGTTGWPLNLLSGNRLLICDSCHGFPPVDPGQTPLARTNAPRERIATDPTGYAAGGGVHRAHVNLFWTKLDPSFDPTSASSTPSVEPDPKVLCGHCHGEGAGVTNHNEATPIQRQFVDMRTRSTIGWGAGATYQGSINLADPASGGKVSAAGTFVCAALDCHGDPDPTRDTGDGAAENARAHFPEILTWADTVTVTTDGTGANQVAKRTVVCKWCHDETPADVILHNPAGSQLYRGVAPDAATPYFRPLSGYSRGGHGDSAIQGEDPFVDSGTGTTPLDCSACHSPTAAHFPAGANLHRLANTTLENDGHTSGALCNSCHSDTVTPKYPTEHHPSYYGATNSNPANHAIVSAAGQEIGTAVGGTTRWENAAGGLCGAGDDFCEQDAYGAANYSGNADRFTNWWAGNYGVGNQSPPPKPVFFGEPQTASPKATLPVERYVLGTGASDRVMCVTCHNPHGTDLYVHDPGGIGAAIPDNNMLRLRDADNALCNACH